MKEKLLVSVGAVVLLLFIFGVPAVLVPFAMDDVPDRSMLRVITLHQQATQTIRHTFKKQSDVSSGRRVAAVPVNTRDWIMLINPMGRKAPGGGVAFLPEADNVTGAIGLTGDDKSVTIILPAYRELGTATMTITAATES